MHTPRHLVISLSTLAGFGRLDRIFYLGGGAYTHTIHPRRHCHKTPRHSTISQEFLDQALEAERITTQGTDGCTIGDTDSDGCAACREGCSVGTTLGTYEAIFASLTKWCGQDSCSRSLTIPQCQTELPHLFWMWDCLSIADQVIINGIFFVWVWWRLFTSTCCSTLRTWYDSIIVFAGCVCFIIRN
jgi:hypothetical protein